MKNYNTHGVVLTKMDIINVNEIINTNPLNQNVVRNVKDLGILAGFTKLGVFHVRIEAGRESTLQHNHEESDEFIYILSGKFELRLGKNCIVLNEGDFVGFPANSEAHSMKNIDNKDSTYLVSGNRPKIDICNYPQENMKAYIKEGKKYYIKNDSIITV